MDVGPKIMAAINDAHSPIVFLTLDPDKDTYIPRKERELVRFNNNSNKCAKLTCVLATVGVVAVSMAVAASNLGS